MNKPALAAAVLDFVLIFPATLFMAALVIRNLPLHELANGAQWIVMWYAGRLWTLWVLLLALPFVALITGCVTLFVAGSKYRTQRNNHLLSSVHSPPSVSLPY